MNVQDAVASRRSVRDFLDTPVPGDVIRRVLAQALRAPSGGNLQPWHLHVVGGDRLAQLKAIMRDRVQEEPGGEGSEYDIYPRELVAPYRDRRFAVGEAMYARRAFRARTRPRGVNGLRATTSSSARRWRCSAPSTAAWGRRSGPTWACSCRT